MLEALQKRNTRHVLHLLLTVVFPPWFFAWVYFAVRNSNHNQRAELALIQLVQNKTLHGERTI